MDGIYCDAKIMDQFGDTDIFADIKNTIEKELSSMKQVVDSISELRVDAANLESNLLMKIDSSTWEQISELTGLGTMGLDVGLDKDAVQIAENK